MRAAEESKLSGVRGKAAREALLLAEAEEVKAGGSTWPCRVGLKSSWVGVLSRQAREALEQSEDGEVQAAELLASVRERLRVLGADAMTGQASVLLKGLGFKAEDLRKPTRLLSGGWRMRVALAKALLAQPNVLLLDEPTNHLDWQAILWLERYLVSELQDVALVVVSHDRDFLDKVSTMTLRCQADFESRMQTGSSRCSCRSTQASSLAREWHFCQATTPLLRRLMRRISSTGQSWRRGSRTSRRRWRSKSRTDF